MSDEAFAGRHVEAIPHRGERLARLLAVIFGAMFVAVGILGFIPGVTTNYGDLEVVGHHSGAELVGLFQVSVLHNILHLALGVAGLIAARSGVVAVGYLVVGGLLYLGLWVYGLVVDRGSDANVVPLNDADNWLHLVLGVAMIGFGLFAQRQLRGGIGSQTPM